MSPLGIPDLKNWQTIFRTEILGTAIATNDGSVKGSVTLKRAGVYTLSVKVNDEDVRGSPFTFLKVKPTFVYIPNCVLVDVPLRIEAGQSYKFWI